MSFFAQLDICLRHSREYSLTDAIVLALKQSHKTTTGYIDPGKSSSSVAAYCEGDSGKSSFDSPIEQNNCPSTVSSSSSTFPSVVGPIRLRHLESGDIEPEYIHEQSNESLYAASSGQGYSSDPDECKPEYSPPKETSLRDTFKSALTSFSHRDPVPSLKAAYRSSLFLRTDRPNTIEPTTEPSFSKEENDASEILQDSDASEQPEEESFTIRRGVALEENASDTESSEATLARISNTFASLSLSPTPSTTSLVTRLHKSTSSFGSQVSPLPYTISHVRDDARKPCELIPLRRVPRRRPIPRALCPPLRTCTVTTLKGKKRASTVETTTTTTSTTARLGVGTAVTREKSPGSFDTSQPLSSPSLATHKFQGMYDFCDLPSQASKSLVHPTQSAPSELSPTAPIPAPVTPSTPLLHSVFSPCSSAYSPPDPRMTKQFRRKVHTRIVACWKKCVPTSKK